MRLKLTARGGRLVGKLLLDCGRRTPQLKRDPLDGTDCLAYLG